MKKSSKLAIIICFCVIGALTAVLGVTLFAVNYNLETAPSVEIVDDGNSLLVTTKVSENYKGYRFRFTSREEVKTFDCQTNSFNISESDLVLGRSYSVAVCYLGEIEGNNSKFGEEKTFVNYAYLASPVLSIVDDKLTWTSVEGADYYLLYCNNKPTTISSTVTELELSALPGGDVDCFIVACPNSNQSFYRQSKPSNVVNKDTSHTLQAFTNLALNHSTMILTADNVEKLDKLNIHVGSTVYQTSNFSITTLVNGSFRYTINISAIYMQSERIGISPVEDENNIFSGDILWA